MANVAKTLLFCILMISLVPMSSALFGRGWSSLFSILDGVKPVDCTYTHWTRWKQCEKTKAGKYQKSRTRFVTRERNNGKPCPPNLQLKENKACSEDEFLVDLFLQQLYQPSDFTSSKSYINTGSRGIFSISSVFFQTAGARLGTPLSQPTPPCMRDSAGRIIASGGCDPKRSRRSVARNLKPRIRRNTQQKNRDVLFLLDESGSVGKKNFEIVKRITAGLIRMFCGAIEVFPDKTQIAVASFDKKNHIHYHFTNRYAKDGVELAKAVKNIKYDYSTAGATCIEKSLSFSRDDMFKTSRGARMNDNGSDQLIVMITDGCRNCGTNSLSTVRKSLENKGIALVTMFLGDDKDCVESLNAELSEGAKCYNFFARHSWTQAAAFAQNLEDKNEEGCMYNVWSGELATSCG